MISRIDERRRSGSAPTAERVRDNVERICERFDLEPPPSVQDDGGPGGTQRFFRTTWYVDRFSQVGSWVAYRTGRVSWIMSVVPLVLAGGFIAAIWSGYYWAGALLLIVAAPFEAIDGFVAKRASNPRRMVFLDYLLDRLGDIVTFGGLAIYLADVDTAASYLSATVMLAALLATYARAQAEALHYRSTSQFGRFTRLFLVTAMALGAAVLGGFEDSTGLVFVKYSLGLLLGLTCAVLVRRAVSVLTSDADFSADFKWDDGDWLPRLLIELTQGDDQPTTLIVTSAEAPEHGTVIHLQRSDSGRLRVSTRRGRIPVDRVG